MRKINKIKLFSNGNEKSEEIKNKLIKLLITNNFEISDDYDLAIAIGGDGSFLRMVKDTNFNSNVYYVGINTGTLGFLQEIKPDKLNEFVSSLNTDDFKVDNIGILETRIKRKNKIYKHYSLNELVIRESNLNVFISNIKVGGIPLETFAGDGLLISTSVGSSAYNMSLRGSLVYNTLHTIQITPIAPLNSRAYRNLLNSVILPEKKHIELIPIKKDILVTFDGENVKYENVSRVECFVKNKKLKFLRMKEYDFISIVNEKFLTD